MDDNHGNGRQEETETETVEPNPGVLRPDNAIVVAIEPVAMLLENGLMLMLFSPIVRRSAIWLIQSSSKIGSSNTF